MGRDGSCTNSTGTGDGLLEVQDTEKGGDGHHHIHAGTSRMGVGYGRSTHGHTDDESDGHSTLLDMENLSKSPCMSRCEITSF